MSLARDSRQEKKVAAYLRAKIGLKHTLERIDYNEDVIVPALQALKAGKSVLGLMPGEAFDIVMDTTDETPAHTTPQKRKPRARLNAKRRKG